MNNLYPIATEETRHLFVDPSIYHPFDILEPGYTTEQSSYLKPGKIPNLMKLCIPKSIRYSITEEPNPDDMFIEEILFSMHYQGCWQVFRVPLMLHLEQRNQGNWGFNRVIEIPNRSVINIEDGKKGLTSDIQVELDININYTRATRCLEYSTSGTYDNGKPQILGICLDLTHKDSKLKELPFKTELNKNIPSNRRAIKA